MSDKLDTGLRDGTVVRHKSRGYQGKIEGTTSIKACFTKAGALLQAATTKEPFQYRIFIIGESMRQVAPLEDLEVIEAAAEIDCAACHKHFYSKAGLVGKPGGRCACGSWICPACLACQAAEAAQDKATGCAHQRKRVSRELTKNKKKSN